MDSNPDPDVHQLLDLIAVNVILFTVGVFILWLLIALLAAAVAPDDRSWPFFWCTFLLLGPIGVALALIAPSRPRDGA